MSGIRANSRRLRELRQLQGLTQEQLALRAGVSVRTVGNAESGRPVRPVFLGYLAEALGVETGDLAADPAELRLARFHLRRLHRVLATMEAFAVHCDIKEYAQLVRPNTLMEVIGPEAIPTTGKYRGPDGLRYLSDRWEDSLTFEGAVEITEIHSAGNELVIVGTNGIRSLQTGKSGSCKFRHHYQFDEDRVVHIQNTFNVPQMMELFTP